MTRVQILPGPAFGTQWSMVTSPHVNVPATQTLHNANLLYQEAHDWIKWTKGGFSLLFCPRMRSFDLAQWYDLGHEMLET